MPDHTGEQVRSDLPPKPDESIAPPDEEAVKRFESRTDYKGFKLPTGMTLAQRRAFKKAIDEREAFPAKFQRQFPRVAKDIVSDTFQGMKETAKEGAKAVGEGLLEAATVVPRTKAAIAADPEGAKQLARSVMSGDREAIRSVATKASEGIAEPFATMGDVTLGGMAAQEGKFGEAAGFAGLVLAPGILQTLGKSMSKGWLKSAAEAGEEIPDEAARKMSDLAKRVDEGKVTDDMQIRRELAQIEDDHAYDYQASLGERDTDFDFESVSRTPAGGDGADALLEAINRRTQEIERRLADLEFSTDEYGNPFQMREVDLELELEDLYDQRQKILSRRGGGGTPGGGGAASFKRDQLDRTERMGLTGSDPKLASPKFGLKDQGHHNVVEDLGPLLPEDRDLLEQFAGKYNLSETELRQLRDEYVAYGYDDFPSRSARGFEEIDIPERPRGRIRSKAERLSAEGIPVRMPAGSGIPKNADALMRNAINAFDMFGSGLGGPTKLYRVRQPNFPEGFSYMEASSPEALEQLLLTNGELFEEFIDLGGIADATKGGRRGDISDFISEASPEESAKYFDMKRGGRSIDDIEGPSESEIEQMVQQGRFGDPYQLEMLKENMRRAAEAQQQADVARTNIRRTRTPGTPGEFGRSTEGTSRAERKGTPRERPKKK